MSAAIPSITSFRTTAGMSVGAASDKKVFAKEPNQPNIQSERANHIPPKIANMNFSFSMAGSALTVSLTDSVSGEIFRKIVYEKDTPSDYRFDKAVGSVIDCSV